MKTLNRIDSDVRASITLKLDQLAKLIDSSIYDDIPTLYQVVSVVGQCKFFDIPIPEVFYGVLRDAPKYNLYLLLEYCRQYTFTGREEAMFAASVTRFFLHYGFVT